MNLRNASFVYLILQILIRNLPFELFNLFLLLKNYLLHVIPLLNDLLKMDDHISFLLPKLLKSLG